LPDLQQPEGIERVTELTIDQVQEWITWEATPGGRAVLRVTLKKDNLVAKHNVRTFRGRIAETIPQARKAALTDLNALASAVDEMDEAAHKAVAS
jgi:hypothetical protein